MLFRINLFLWLVCFLPFIEMKANEAQMTESARVCVQCHGGKYYSYQDPYMDVTVKKRMNPYFVIDTLEYLQGEHHTFSCDDCHSPDYATYPHNAELKLEPKYTCQDCHGGDEAYAHLHFDEIEEEVSQSVHAKALGETFRCELCHDPHTNKLVARSNQYNIKEIVQVNNSKCLYCHDEVDNYQLYTDNKNPELKSIHDWLPNQGLHFSKVRCIECHTAVDDTFMVAHRILPKEEAVQNCAQCHSKDNMLNAKLYKYINREEREEKGFYSATFSNEAYIIGNHYSPFLNVFGIVVFCMTVIGIIIHIIMRVVKSKES